MFATGVTMGLAEWIFDDTCLVVPIFEWNYFSFLGMFFQITLETYWTSFHYTEEEYYEEYWNNSS